MFSRSTDNFNVPYALLVSYMIIERLIENSTTLLDNSVCMGYMLSWNIYRITNILVVFLAPSAPPTIESLLPLTQRSVRVRFSPPPRDHWNSDSLRGYIIEYRPSPQTSDPNDPITYNTSSTGGILTKDIENLQPFSE